MTDYLITFPFSINLLCRSNIFIFSAIADIAVIVVIVVIVVISFNTESSLILKDSCKLLSSIYMFTIFLNSPRVGTLKKFSFAKKRVKHSGIAFFFIIIFFLFFFPLILISFIIFIIFNIIIIFFINRIFCSIFI